MKAFKRAALAVLLAVPSADGFQLPSSATSTRHHLVDPIQIIFSGHNQPLPIAVPTRLFSTLEKPKSETAPAAGDAANGENDEKTADALHTQRFLGSPIPYSELTVGVLRETYPGENRVSVAPESVRMLVKEGLNVVVESGGEFSIY